MSDLEVIRRAPFNAETPAGALRQSETSAAHVYVRSNFSVPILSATHTVTVRGLVRAPFVLSVGDLEALPQHTVGATMECAGNDRMTMTPLPAGEPWKHGALSTVSWTGVPLALLLDRADVDPSACEIVFSGADSGPRDDAPTPVRFERSLPFAEARQSGALLALRMNGEPLTAAHGAPVRLVVPGWYGMASVKWLAAIEARATPFTGYFQRQRYVYDDGARIEPVTRMRVKSIIASPNDGAVCTRDVVVEGWAWSGAGAITRVEVAIDGGESWQDATLGAPTSPHAWTPFRIALSLAPGSRSALRSRATDATGASQPAYIAWNRLGYGNNAVRSITVNVNE